MNKTSVAINSDSILDDCNKLNSDVESLNVFNGDATCVFCRKSVLSGTHTKCVANTFLHLKKKRTSGISSRPATASKSILGKPPSIVSKAALVSPVVAKNNPKKDPKVSEFLKKKA